VVRGPERRASRRRAAEVPLVVELVRVAVAAGASPRHALGVARDAAGPCRAALDAVLVAADLGPGLVAACEVGADEHPELARLLRAVAAADRSGAPLVDALARLGRATRVAVRRDAERQARTVPVRLLLPLVLLVLPAFALVTVVPAVVAGVT
jgi:tight adherence protein C